ncbi:hypothetical protein P3T25_009872 [Paraburkholderia sp. GAS32]
MSFPVDGLHNINVARGRECLTGMGHRSRETFFSFRSLPSGATQQRSH